MKKALLFLLLLMSFMAFNVNCVSASSRGLNSSQFLYFIWKSGDNYILSIADPGFSEKEYFLVRTDTTFYVSDGQTSGLKMYRILVTPSLSDYTKYFDGTVNMNEYDVSGRTTDTVFNIAQVQYISSPILNKDKTVAYTFDRFPYFEETESESETNLNENDYKQLLDTMSLTNHLLFYILLFAVFMVIILMFWFAIKKFL